jgi:hypothetical protein
MEIECPHCLGLIIINENEINCSIFRHAVYKTDINQQLPPHSSKEVCDDAVERGIVYGCAKPFKLVKSNSTNEEKKYKAEICDYI